MKAFIVSLFLFIATGANALGSGDRSFWLQDDVTGKSHSVTENSIEVCKTMPHYSIVKLDGVDRRCVQSIKWGATTLPKE